MPPPPVEADRLVVRVPAQIRFHRIRSKERVQSLHQRRISEEVPSPEEDWCMRHDKDAAAGFGGSREFALQPPVLEIPHCVALV